MRKTRKCDRTSLHSSSVGSRIYHRMRTCLLMRGHDGDHVDEHGAWKEPGNA